MQKLYFFFCFLSLGFLACQPSGKRAGQSSTKLKVESEKNAQTLPAYKRVVVIGDELLEAMCQIGDSLKIVAVGKPHPKVANRKLPAVGYKGSLQISLIKQAKPDAVIGEREMIDDKIAAAIEELGIPCYRFAKPTSIKEMEAYLKELGRVLRQEKLARQWADSLAYNMARIEKICKKKRKDTLRVMYVQARTSSALLMGGAGTLPDLMLRLAGMKNAGEEFDGMESLKFDLMQTINPDFIVLTKRTLNSLQANPQEAPQFTSSQAYRMGRVLVLEDHELQGLPFQTGKTSWYVCKKLYQDNYFSALPLLKDTPVALENGVQEPKAPETPRRDKVDTSPTPAPKGNETGLDELKGGGL